MLLWDFDPTGCITNELHIVYCQRKSKLLTNVLVNQVWVLWTPSYECVAGWQAHPVRVCKIPERPAVHLAAPSSSAEQPVRLLAVQARHVDLWQTATTAATPMQVSGHSSILW